MGHALLALSTTAHTAKIGEQDKTLMSEQLCICYATV